MNDPASMRAIECVRDLNADLQHLCEGQRPLLQSFRERLAGDMLHHQVLDAILVTDVVKDADMRVGQRGNAASLTLEPFASCRIE